MRFRRPTLLWYPDACKSEGPEHRFSGQTSRLACVGLFTPIDSEFEGHAKTGLRPTHAILGQKSIFRPGQAQPASDPEILLKNTPLRGCQGRARPWLAD